MDYYGVDSDEMRIKQLLAQAAALRGTRAPTGQTTGSGGFQHYVAPHWSQQISPVTGNIAAEFVEGRANDMLDTAQTNRADQVVYFLRRRPTEGDEQKEAEWAASGMGSPGTRQLAGKIIEDNLIQAPARREKAQARTDQIKLTNDRYEEDRKARAQQNAMMNQARMERLQVQLSSTNNNAAQQRELQRQMAQANLDFRRQQLESQMGQKEADRELKAQQAQDKAQAALTGGGLSATQKKEVSLLTDSIRKLTDLNNNFKDEYSGGAAFAKTIVSPYGALIPKSIYNAEDPKNADVTEYWRQYDAIGNMERHELFGSALTKVEQEAWKKQALPPTATPTQIRASNAARLKIVQEALDNKLNLYQGGQLDTTTGRTSPRVKLTRDPAPATPSGRPRVAPAEQRSRDDDRKGVLDDELRSQSNVHSREDYDALVREAKAAGVKDIPPYKGEKSEKKRLKYNPATGELE